MKKYQVSIRTIIYEYRQIEAEDIEEARELARDLDYKYLYNSSGIPDSVEIESVEEV